MSTGYAIIPFGPEHAEAAARLHAIVSTSDPSLNYAYLEWKYGQNPYLGWRHLYLAFLEGQLVAMRGFFGSCWEIDGSAVVVPCGADLIIEPAHRNRSLVSALNRRAMTDLAAAGFPCAFSLSAIPVSALGLLAAGWKSVAPVTALRARRPAPFRMALRRGKAALRQFLGRRHLGGVALAPTGSEGRVTGRAPLTRAAFKKLDAPCPGGRGGICLEKAPRAEAMAELVQRLDQGGAIRHVRDATYLRWRFKNPLSDYRFLYAEDGRGALEGYLILCAPRFDRYGDVRVVDWEARSSDAKRRLLQTALDRGGFASVTAWSLGLDETAAGILRTLGFEGETEEGIAKLGLKVLVKAFNGDPAAPWTVNDVSILDPGQWQMRMIYSDCC